MLDPVSILAREIARLPGIGVRSAHRLAHYLVKKSFSQSQNGQPSLADDLARALQAVQQNTRLCVCCRNFTTEVRCQLCEDPRRNPAKICVVASVMDLQAIENAGVFGGLYFVLHGVLSPLEGMGPSDLDVEGLLERARQPEISEVVLATNADVEGDTTAMYLADRLDALGILTTRLASGIPMGGALEHLDGGTLTRAFDARQKMSA